MATYGYDDYGLSTYGPTPPTGNYPGSQITIPVVNTAYIFPGMAATVQDYGNILVTWGPLGPGTNATVTEFRLISNTWGFPVDENDGTIVLDVTGAPPSYPYSYVDTSPSPGTVQYYGIYVLSAGVWLRGGFTAGLMPYYYGYDIKLMQDLPAFFQSQTIDTVVTDIPVPAPTMPSSGGNVSNPYSYDVDVWLSFACNVLVNNIPLGMQSFFTLPANGSVTISYSSAPEWQWVNRAEQPDNQALPQFLAVVGMGLDLVKSQYDQKFNSLNNPMTMSLGDLENLCAEIGLPYNPELPAYTTRKAALFWGRVMQERGTLAGIAEHITLLTGYQADIQTTRNFMLDDDQSEPDDPRTAPWSANMSYVAGNLVTFPVAQSWSVVSTYNVGSVVMYNDLFYTCTVANTTQVLPTTTANWSQSVNGPYLYVCILANENEQPSGSLSATTYWTAVYGGDKNGAEYNVPISISGLASNSGTWEFTNASGAAYASAMGVGFPTPQAWAESGTTPVTGPNGYGNTFRVNNNTGSTITNALLRSVARSTAGVTATALYPDPQLVIEHGVPVPSGIQPWNSTTTYQTNQVVSFGNTNFIALRQSTGATPPGQQVVLNQNYDFETGITPWQGNNATVTQSASFAYHGTHSMSLVSTAVNGYAFPENVPAIPGATYVATALAFASTGTPSVSLHANWNDPFGTYLSGAFPTAVVLATSTWTAISNVFTVPNNAGTVYINPTNAASGVTTYWDLVELTCVATPEWAPLGADHRLPVTMSGYAISDLGFTPTVSTTVTPFAEFYDSWGSIITRVFARTSSTSGGYPTNYQFDGFDTGAGYPLAGRLPAIPTAVWSVPAGTWTVSTNGVAYAGTSDADAIGVVASAAQGTSAVTVSNPAQAGDDCGALFWYENTSNFWMAGLSALYYVESATTRVVAYTGTAPATGDRIYAEFNNTTSTTTIPTGTLVGPSVLVYKNSRTSANTLVVIGSGGTATHTAMSSLTTPYLPSTSATTSNAGIASIAT